MRASHLLLPLQLLPLLLLPALATPALAEIKIATDHNTGDSATADFKFKSVPSPVKGSAAAKAKVSLLDGKRDGNGAELSALNDNNLPAESDEPSNNFFFAQGKTAGRILFDLGAPINIKQISSYSWHAGTRGPQVYNLYAAEGTEKDFDAKLANNADPEKSGWKLLAKIDTRPKNENDYPGQYGVSITEGEKSEKNIGKFRYVLVAAQPTETDDPFGNTFYSEFNIIDADKPLDKVVSDEKAPANPAAIKTITFGNDKEKYVVTINSTEVPELTEWANGDVAKAVEEWYPKLVEMLPSDGYKAPQKFSITIKKDMDGVAYTAGNRIVCASKYFLPRKGDVGAIVHEMVHVVQQYKGNNPGWLVEGLADQVRWFIYEPVAKRPRKPDPAKAKYTDSYQVTAGFLTYVVETHDKELIKKLNADMRNGKYKPELWKTYTGKTVDELWSDYTATLKK